MTLIPPGLWREPGPDRGRRCAGRRRSAHRPPGPPPGESRPQMFRQIPGRAIPMDGMVARQGPCHHHRLARHHLTACRCLGPAAQVVERGGGQLPQGDRLPGVAAKVGERHGLQGLQHQTTGAQGPGQGMPAAPIDQISPAGDHPGLGSTEQLVAAERDDRRRPRPVSGGRRVRRPARMAARARATGSWHRADPTRGPRPRDLPPPAVCLFRGRSAPGPNLMAGLAGQFDQFGDPHGRHKAGDPVVGWVHLEHQGRVLAEGAVIIGEPGPVGRSNLDQAGAGRLENVRYAETRRRFRPVHPG